MAEPAATPAHTSAPPFEDVLQQFQPLITCMVRAFHVPGRPYPDRDDLAQVAAIALWEAHSHCTNWDTFSGLAKCIIRAALIELVEAEGDANPPLRLDAPLSNHANLTLLDSVAALSDDRDLLLTVREALTSLPQSQATIVWAVAAMGWPARAWARSRGQHTSTVRGSLARGRRNFRQAWLGRSSFGALSNGPP